MIRTSPHGSRSTSPEQTGWPSPSGPRSRLPGGSDPRRPWRPPQRLLQERGTRLLSPHRSTATRRTPPASAVGGLVCATFVRGAVRAVRLPLDIGLAFVALVPDKPLVDRPGETGAAATGVEDGRNVQPGTHGASACRTRGQVIAHP